MNNDDISNVTVRPGEPLLLRCRSEQQRFAVWERNGSLLDPKSLPCGLKDEVQTNGFFFFNFPTFLIQPQIRRQLG